MKFFEKMSINADFRSGGWKRLTLAKSIYLLSVSLFSGGKFQIKTDKFGRNWYQ
ncbi:MAG: hypothetical protein Q8O88_05120 [bacterium]|nr:hypothetical protein [bacterium]